MLRLLAVIFTVVNVALGLLVGTTRGAGVLLFGLPNPLPFYGDLLAVFLVATGLCFIPAIRRPDTYRFYLWVMGVGVKLVVALLFLRIWIAGVAPAVLLAAAIGEAVLGALMLVALLQERGIRTL